MENLPYDKNDPLDIEKYAKKLEGRKFSEVLEEYYHESIVKESKIVYSENNILKKKLEKRKMENLRQVRD